MGKKNRNLDGVIGIVFVIVMILTVIAMIYFFQVNPPVGVFLLGSIFFVLGIFAIMKGGISLKEAWVLLFPLVGLECMGVSATYIWSFSFLKDIRLDRDKIIVLLVVLLFFITGLWMVVKELLADKRKKRIYTYAIQAKCIDVKETCGGEGSTVCIPVFQYTYEGKEYVHSGYWDYHKGAPFVNQYYTLLLKPENPAEAWFPDRPLKWTRFLMSVVFMLLPLIVAYKFLWR
ncbi:MAG: hypothetical protein HDR01_04665 [Lachnospiraceae bacterium]|nr:hypothetical protein [Lachnospiraceae bacterium]